MGYGSTARHDSCRADRAQVTFVEGWAKYGSNELMPPGLYVYAVFRCPTGGYAIRL